MKIIKSIPRENIYFDEKIIKAGDAPEHTELCVVNVFDDIEYQSVLGFGGAFTESAAYLYSLLNDEQKKKFMEIVKNGSSFFFKYARLGGLKIA